MLSSDEAMVSSHHVKKAQLLPYSQDSYCYSTTCDDDNADQMTAAEPSLDHAICLSQALLLSQQHPEGYWWGKLESNVSITAESLLLYKILGIAHLYPLPKIQAYIRSKFRPRSGAWELFYGDGGNLSVTVEAYMALRLLGVPKSNPLLSHSRRFILSHGGASKSRIFTKLCLALLGCFDWRAFPALPPWFMLFASWFPTSIYEMASWARSCVVPLFLIFDRKLVIRLTDGDGGPPLDFDELYVEGSWRKANAREKFRGELGDLFLIVDYGLKVLERFRVVPFRQRGLREAERWTVQRQEETGDWAGIFPAMFYSILGLFAVGYAVSHPLLDRGLKAIRGLSIETGDLYWVQSGMSPIWDTAFVARTLVESGVPPDHPSLRRAGLWLLQKQILQLGDWAVKNPYPSCCGGWAFEFNNRWYPDVDDTAVVVMALDMLELEAPEEERKRGAIAAAVNWVASMQSKNGGWGAFDKDNNQEWMNAMPFADMKAMLDRSSADVTGKVLEMVGRLRARAKGGGEVAERERMVEGVRGETVERGKAYLRREQEEGEGCWKGRWGVNYVYGTCGAMVGLAVVAGEEHAAELEKGAKWLAEVRNKEGDGGWGETPLSYNGDPKLKGRMGDGDENEGRSMASQTAWAVMGLLAAGDVLGKYEVEAIEGGVEFLLRTQRADGSWFESGFTGTGFPCHFYMRYHYYAQHFPLAALARYRARLHRIAAPQSGRGGC